MKDCKDVKCDPLKICNPASGRCVLRTGRIGKNLLPQPSKSTRSFKSKKSSSRASPCKTTQRLDKNGQCVCKSKLQILNPYTKNCVAIKGIAGKKILAGTLCPPGETYNNDTKKCEETDKRERFKNYKLPPFMVSPSRVKKTVQKFRPKTRKCTMDSLTKLTPVQAFTVDYFSTVDSLLVVFDTGMGKTLTALTASQCYLKDNPDSRVIIVTQKTLLGNFHNEFVKYGNVDPSKYEVHTYDGILNGFKNETPVDAKGALVIIDEVHTLRNHLGVKFFACMKLVNKASKVLMLTATPFVNSLCDFISIINLLNKKYVISPKYSKLSAEKMIMPIFEQPTKYRMPHCSKSIGQLDSGGGGGLLQQTEMISHLLEGKVCFAQKTIGSGTLYPSVEIYNDLIPMDPEFEREFLLAVDFSSKLFASPEKFANGYRRAVNKAGGKYFSKKIKYAIKKIEDGKGKYAKNLIFSNWIEYGIDILEKELNEKGIKYGLITGQTSAKDRIQIVKDFNNYEMTTLVISNAGSTGIDLKGVQQIIVLDPVWNNAMLDQIKGRGVRYKSHEDLPEKYRNVRIYLPKLVEKSYIDGTLKFSKSGDLILYEIIKRKMKVEKLVIDMMKDISVLHKFSDLLDKY